MAVNVSAINTAVEYYESKVKKMHRLAESASTMLTLSSWVASTLLEVDCSDPAACLAGRVPTSVYDIVYKGASDRERRLLDTERYASRKPLTVYLALAELEARIDAKLF